MADEAGYMSIRREAVIDTDIAHAYGVVMQLSRTVESFASQIRDLIPRANRLRDHAWMLIDGKREIASIERIRALFEAGGDWPSGRLWSQLLRSALRRLRRRYGSSR